MTVNDGGWFRTVLLQRIENGAVAVAIVSAVIVAGLPWWVLAATFVLFDLSAIGYLHSPRSGAVSYNLVHNYTPPALLAAGYALGHLVGTPPDWIVLLAASWGFHVAIDRALGFGLKLTVFSRTHLSKAGSYTLSG
ncbi:MAG TPA: DUF4260 family protein [Ruania sp.]|nr:DUF4260 family protein [Ruania sp.]